MKLKITIRKIKSIDSLTIELPIEKGLYAITGQNGSGKSTIAACASSVFFNVPMKEYFGKTDDDASIHFEMGDSKRGWKKDSNNSWSKYTEGPVMNIKGFFEGSLIFGNRFKDMNYENIIRLDAINQNKLIRADEFIRKNLGQILQGDDNFYEKLWLVSPNYEKFKGDIFYYEKNGKRISQFHMSTGENLLISILNSLYIRNKDRASLTKPCMIFLDEIELALHPSSLKRLVQFLKETANRYNYAIYFSTHSIELISGISPSNIFFIDRHADNTIEVINPCYPAYATRILYDHNGYDKVILVEDDLAKGIVERVLRSKNLLNNKLVHVLPCGGYTKVIDLADDVITHNLLGRKASISIVLDGDIRDKAEQYRIKQNIGNNIPLNFLPIESLEKYLKNKLFLNVDHKLFRKLNDYVFQNKSLTELIDTYKKRTNPILDDKDGKILFGIIDTELRERRIERSELVAMVVDYLFDTQDGSLSKLISFLQTQLET
ncbi:MAG: AAA family ATPase [Bacteroidaceae bacterium]|nr:AAA family ATPase [Bacteroidaceae bacterium]